jgi:hypothetical protein
MPGQLGLAADLVKEASLDGNRNPLDNIARYLFLPPVVKPRRSRTGVAGQILHVIERHALRQQVGNRGDAEGMRR